VETLGHLQPGYSSVLRGDTHVDPSLEFYATEDEALSKLSDKLRELLKMGLSASDIVILSAISEQSSAARLSAIGNWKGVLVPYSSRTATGRIRYTTIHAFKGLEAPAVVVTDIEKLDSVRSGDLFYIALSRALHRLDVLAHARTQEPIRQILNESISHE
jgi:superfamily I DNA/RNA helicase